MTTVMALLTNKAYGYPTRDARRRRKPTILACLHQTANAKATALQERNYANRAGSAGPSATAYIDRDGTIVRAIDPLKYAAWCQGDVAHPPARPCLWPRRPPLDVDSLQSCVTSVTSIRPRTDHAHQSNRSRHNALYSTRAWQRLSARVLRAWRGEHGDWCPGSVTPLAVFGGLMLVVIFAAALWPRAPRTPWFWLAGAIPGLLFFMPDIPIIIRAVTSPGSVVDVLLAIAVAGSSVALLVSAAISFRDARRLAGAAAS